MHKNLIKNLLVILIIFSNYSFGKEFKELFTIYTPLDRSQNVESSINKSFNNLVYRISGTKSPSNIWKIINSGSSRKDFINSYSIKNINQKDYLEVKFNRDAVIDKFKQLSIPIIGDTRPVILFLIKIESGKDTPYYLSNDSKNDIDKFLINSLTELSNERGIFLELPIFDLEDRSYLLNLDILSSTEDYLLSKYRFDDHVNIKLTNLGLNKWSFTQDIVFVTEGDKYLDDLKKIFIGHVESIITKSLENLIIDTTNDFYVDLFIEGIESYKDYKIAKENLSKIVSIANLDIQNFKNNEIKYRVKIIGSMNTLINSLNSNNFFEVSENFDNKTLKLTFNNE